MYDFEKLRKYHDVAVHCPTLDAALSFVNAYKEEFPNKYFGGNPGNDEYWHQYKENTCYNPNLGGRGRIQYCDIDYYIEEGYMVLSESEIRVMPDIGEFDKSDVDMKCLFGME